MSLLLEALKKAALEKQGKSVPDSADAPEVSPATARPETTPVKTELKPEPKPVAKQEVEVEPKPEPIPKLEAETQPVKSQEPDTPGTRASSVHIEPHFALPDSKLLNPEADKPSTEHTWDPTLKFDIEVDESLFEEEPDPEPWLDPSKLAQERTASEQTNDEEEEESEASDSAPQPAIEEITTSDHIVDSSLATDDNPIGLQKPPVDLQPEPEPVEPREDELDQERRVAYLETKRQEKIKEEGKAALEHLITSGQQRERSTKRRARFLYAMLIMTAFGGIVSYYFYLLANSNISELQSETVSLAETRETILDLDPLSPIDETPEQNNSSFGTSAIIDNNQTNAETSSTATSYGSTFGQNTTGSTSDSISGSLRDSAYAESQNQPGSETTSGLSARNGGPALVPRDDSAPSVDEYKSTLSNFNSLTNLNTNAIEDQPQRVIVHHQPLPAEVSTHIQNGYRALQRKDYRTAAAEYEQAVALAPDNRDAILGAAAAATAQNRIPEALRYYQQQLNLNPGDSHARAGFLSLASRRNSASIKRELDQLIETNPRSAHLYFLKGINHASDRQWSSAQQAFFEAYFRDKGNPDYAYNLAVSLDHLNQKTQALRFYQLALDNDANATANFEAVNVRRRLSQLQLSSGQAGEADQQ